MPTLPGSGRNGCFQVDSELSAFFRAPDLSGNENGQWVIEKSRPLRALKRKKGVTPSGATPSSWQMTVLSKLLE
ncbi:MAG TPA: hypothetical protein PKY22_09180 [Accumulibacter sp.]|nr:hypothetical protein [Accumulibacter sp.]